MGDGHRRFGSLTFDRWRGDQVVQVTQWDDDRGQVNGLMVGQDDREGGGAWLGRSQDGRVQLTLDDRWGRTRLRLMVDANGTPTVKAYDEDGAVVWALPTT